MTDIFDLNTAPVYDGSGERKLDNNPIPGRASLQASANAESGWLRKAPKQAPADSVRSKARATESRSTSRQPRNDGMISYARLREIIAEIKASREAEI